MLFQLVLAKLSAEQKTVKLLWVANLIFLLFACSDAISNGIPVNLQHRIVFQPIQSQVVIVIIPH
jgi:hypothetical protein